MALFGRTIVSIIYTRFGGVSSPKPGSSDFRRVGLPNLLVPTAFLPLSLVLRAPLRGLTPPQCGGVAVVFGHHASDLTSFSSKVSKDIRKFKIEHPTPHYANVLFVQSTCVVVERMQYCRASCAERKRMQY